MLRDNDGGLDLDWWAKSSAKLLGWPVNEPSGLDGDGNFSLKTSIDARLMLYTNKLFTVKKRCERSFRRPRLTTTALPGKRLLQFFVRREVALRAFW